MLKKITCKHMFLPLQPVPPLPRRSTYKGYRQYPWKNWPFFRLQFLPVSMAAPGARFAFLRQAQKEKGKTFKVTFFPLNIFFGLYCPAPKT